MNKWKGRVETSKRGFIPTILDLADDRLVDYVLDNAFVEFGTGCWVDTGGDPDLSYEAQIAVYEVFHGPVPEGEFVFNSCNDYRICHNPNCLATMELPEYDFDVETDSVEDEI